MSHERLLTPGNKLRVAGGKVAGGWGNGVMGVREGTSWDEHQVLYATGSVLNSIPETRDILLTG